MRPIKITQELKENIMADFEKFLTNERMSGSEIKYNKYITNAAIQNVKKPIVYFTSEAYLKILELVLKTDSEIGWHGTVLKEDNNYIIDDIIVYPQTVTGVTVTTDDAEYGNWLMKQPDEVFDRIRFQGHSHVYMTPSPSGVDTNFYDSILQSLKEGEYYIFMIINKRQELNIWVYDFAQNVIFETKDIDMRVVDDKFVSISAWAQENKDKYVKTPKVFSQTGKVHTLRDPEYYTELNRLDRFNNPNLYNYNNDHMQDDDGFEAGKKSYGKNKHKEPEKVIDGKRVKI